MTRAEWSTRDTPVIRAAVLAIVSESPLDFRALRVRVTAASGVEVGERRLYRVMRWATKAGLVRKVRPESWRDEAGYVRVMGRAA